MTSTTRNILTVLYDDLTLSERVNACAAARDAGYDAAADDRAAAGGIDAVMYPWQAYYYSIVEPAWDAEQCSDAVELDYRSTDHYEDDPRVRAFAEGWENSMSSAAQDDFEQRFSEEDAPLALQDAQREAGLMIEFYDNLPANERGRWWNRSLLEAPAIVQALAISDLRRIDAGLKPEALS